MRGSIKMLQVFLLLLTGVLSTGDWKVTNPVSICGVRGSNVSIPCNFTYPKDKQLKVTNVSWCSKKEKDKCDQEGPYVYNSSNKDNPVNFRYTGNNISDCSLLISNINSSNSGVYLFRFITNSTEGPFTSDPGINIIVTDLNISMTRLRDNGSITVGDSLNLTCTVSCPSYLPELQWFKNNYPTKHSGPILIFSNVTLKDSGNYSCALKHFISSASKQISLYVEGTDTTFWLIIIVVSIIAFVFIVALLILIARRAKNQETQKDGKTTKRADDVPQDEEVQYASVSVKPKELPSNTEQQNEDSVIYSAVTVPKGNKPKK